MVITRLTRNQLAGQPARGFESHRLRQIKRGGKMNTSMKDRIKMSIAISVLMVVIIVVILIIIQYQIEGEKNMPYQLSKITIISTAEGEQNTENPEESSKWNLSVNQNNDVYFFIDKNTDKDELLDSVTIDNINVTKQPAKGVVKVFMPNSLEGRTFTYDASYLVENGLEYKGGKTSNPKTLEICNQGGSAVIRFANTNVGNFVSNDDTEVQHNGTLLTKIGTTEEETKFQVNFDFIIQANKIKYKTNITLSLPCEKLLTKGTSNKEITDMSEIVFKRIK